jgi:hypothetical protein
MSLHTARGGAHEDLSWSVIGRRAPRDVTFGDREGGDGMRRAQQGQGAVRVDEASSASTFRELDEAFLQVRSRSFSVWLGLLEYWGEQGANGTVSVLAWTSGPPRFSGVPSAVLADGRLLYWCQIIQ